MQPCTERDLIQKLAVESGRHAERLSDLEEHRKRQNGILLRIEDKIDNLIRWLMTASITLLGGFVLGLIAWLVQRG